MREWAFSICLAVVAGCLIKMIIPRSKTGKMINLIMSIFLLSCMFSGFMSNRFKLDVDFDMEDQISDISDRLESVKETRTIGWIQRELESKVYKDLLNYKINPIKILININIDDCSSILINSMEIFLREGEDYDEMIIKNYIQRNYDVLPSIIVSK